MLRYEGYCDHHHRALSSEVVACKSCRKKENTGEVCRHFKENNKVYRKKYRNTPRNFRRN